MKGEETSFTRARRLEREMMADELRRVFKVGLTALCGLAISVTGYFVRDHLILASRVAKIEGRLGLVEKKGDTVKARELPTAELPRGSGNTNR